jgi:excisionase family DNA binding protein
MERQTQFIKRALGPLRQALETHRRSLEELESALLEFEEALQGQGQERPQAQQGNSDLLSIMDVCQELGMGKSWVYRRIQSGDIPSVKLGNNLKVKRQDLEDYIEGQRHRSRFEVAKQEV